MPHATVETMLAGSALVGLLLVLFAFVLMRKLRIIVIEIYKRLEAIHAAVASVRTEADHVRGEVVGARAEARTRAMTDATSELRRIAFTNRLSSYYAQDNVAAHLAALAADSLDEPEIGYALARAAGSVAPRMIERGSGDTVVCSLALGDDYRHRVLPALASQQFFAESRDLSYAILSDPPKMLLRPPAWMKIPLMMHLLQRGFRRIIYIDADALVTSLDFDIEAAFGDARPQGLFKVTEDEDGVNSGVVLLQDGPLVRRLLDLIWMFDADIHNGTWEQYALKTLMDQSQAVRRHVTIEPDPRRFNSFPIERRRFHRTPEPNIWHPGDFICHFSGIRSPDLEILLENYATQIAPLRYYRPAA